MGRVSGERCDEREYVEEEFLKMDDPTSQNSFMIPLVEFVNLLLQTPCGAFVRGSGKDKRTPNIPLPESFLKLHCLRANLFK
jgi:hypothetical protein